MTVLRTANEQATFDAGRALAGMLLPDDVVSLSGDLGAGKTVLVRGVADGMGVVGPVTSPTFNILLLHPGRLTLYHFDLYRLEREGQLEDVDFYGTLEAGGVSFVEWGERFPDALPPDHLAVSLRIAENDTRALELLPTGPRSRTLAEDWAGACRGLRGCEVT